MRILLDTHVLIWLLEGSNNLSNAARSAIENDGNSLYLSIVSLWEITIKLSLGKLDLQISVNEVVESFYFPRWNRNLTYSDRSFINFTGIADLDAWLAGLA